MLINGIEFALNDVISFSTTASHDTNVYTGRLVALGVSYDIARSYGDILAYHDQVPLDPKPEVSTLTYIVIVTSQGDYKPFAIEWLDVGSVTKVEAVSDKFIFVQAIPDNIVPQVLNYIRSLGYACRTVNPS